MTHAICVRCGAMKFGCLLPCPACGQTPRTARRFAYSYFFSDHYHDLSQLQDWSRETVEHRHYLPLLRREDEDILVARCGHATPVEDADAPDALSPLQ